MKIEKSKKQSNWQFQDIESGTIFALNNGNVHEVFIKMDYDQGYNAIGLQEEGSPFLASIDDRDYVVAYPNAVLQLNEMSKNKNG